MPEMLVAQVIGPRRLLQLGVGDLAHQLLLSERGTESRSASPALSAGPDIVFLQPLLGPAIDGVDPHLSGDGGVCASNETSMRHLVCMFNHSFVSFQSSCHFSACQNVLRPSRQITNAYSPTVIVCPIAQLVERWTPGSESTGLRRSGARYMELLTGMARLVGAAAAS